jgi:nucleotide-binding universal stress UspA family protein
MASRRRSFSIVVATDGSLAARAAVAAAGAFPWPRGTRASGVVARQGFTAPAMSAEWPAQVWDALERALEQIRRDAQAQLARRWPGAEVVIADGPPAEAILRTARRLSAGGIVVGSRGHGLLGRLFLGSVSRAVVRGARCPVLVIKGRRPAGQHVVLGLDGSPHARRAVELLARLAPKAGAQVTVVRVVEPIRLPSLGPAPAAVRSAVQAQADARTAEVVAAARREVEAAARRLGRAGWRTRALVPVGAPLPELLHAVRGSRADLLAIGARGVGGVERLLLGSVAEGAVSRAPVSVLMVR